MTKNEELKQKFEAEIKGKNCFLNPDKSFTDDLIEGLLVNEERYGYQNCPCRLSANDKDADIDIICPCYYRDPDVAEFGNCYCALFVSKEVMEGKQKTRTIPERRPSKEIRQKLKHDQPRTLVKTYWYCTVCGDIHYGEAPPKTCPTCLMDDVYLQITKEEAMAQLA